MTIEADDQISDSTSENSVSISAGGDINVGGDFVRRDKIVNIIHNYYGPGFTAQPSTVFHTSKSDTSQKAGIDNLHPKKDWSFFETELFASAEVVESLVQQQNWGVLAVDNGTILYLPPGFDIIDSNGIAFSIADLTMPFEFKNPSEEELLHTISTESNKVQAYLRERAKGGAVGSFRTKVGITCIEPPIPRVKKPLTLHIAPLSYWTVREFNRRILDNPDIALAALREESLREILSRKDAVTIPCPSALYLEFSIVTRDGKLVVLEKNTGLSSLAKRGHRWTCTIEEGLEWREFIQPASFDLGTTVQKSMEIELAIRPEDIISIELFGIALEHTHLNCAILGNVTINLSSDELKPKISQSADFGRDYKFLDLNSALKDLFIKQDNASATWHPTGRIRALLTLYRLLGVDKTRRGLKSAIGKQTAKPR